MRRVRAGGFDILGAGGMKALTESQIQQQFVSWLEHKSLTDSRYANFFKVPNETRGNFAWLTKMKREGLKKGVPDMLCIEPRPPFRGLALEFKCKGGKISKEQQVWLNRFRAAKWLAKVVYTVEQAIAVAEQYMECSVNAG